MRPGQEAPDDPAQRVQPPAEGDFASMRPGQEAPDDPTVLCTMGTGMGYSFNEAGARSPG